MFVRFLIIVVALVLLFKYMSMLDTESFDVIDHAPDFSAGSYWDPLWMGKSLATPLHGKTSLDCYSESKRDCVTYSNCGLCHSHGKTECVPGDEQGPLFKEGCNKWQYMNYYDRHIFGDKVERTTRDWSYRYPDFLFYPSPVSRSAL